MEKKAQLKIQQIAFMLIALTIFFAMIGLIFLAVKMSSLRESVNVLEEEKSIELASKIANSPELSCQGSFDKTNCIDSDKAMALSLIPEFDDFWEVKKIQVMSLTSENNVKCNNANYPKCNLIDVYSKQGVSEGTSYSNFVSLCRKEIDAQGNKFDKCELGVILVNPIEK